MALNEAAIKGEAGTGYEPRIVDGIDKGPFACWNCKYFNKMTVSCGQEDMMKKSKLPRLPSGRVKLKDREDCCEYIFRMGRKRGYE